jgi:hypothetical protein
MKAFQDGLKKPPSQGGGAPGGGEGGGGRGAAGGAAAPAANRDIKAMGKLPVDFTGDREKADNFIEEVKAYLCLNADVPGFDSPIRKMAFTLTHIKGHKVAGWLRDMGIVYDSLNPATDNIPELWEYFLEVFTKQWQDNTKEERAWQKLKNLRMKGQSIDEFITEFEETA